MTTKQNPTVKVGDILIIRRSRFSEDGHFTEKVIRVTPTGLIKTANRTLGPDLRIRGLPQWSSILCQAELATPERLAEIQAQQLHREAKRHLMGFDWQKLPGPVALEVLQTLRRLLKESEAKDAQEKSE